MPRSTYAAGCLSGRPGAEVIHLGPQPPRCQISLTVRPCRRSAGPWRSLRIRAATSEFFKYIDGPASQNGGRQHQMYSAVGVGVIVPAEIRELKKWRTGVTPACIPPEDGAKLGLQGMIDERRPPMRLLFVRHLGPPGRRMPGRVAFGSRGKLRAISRRGSEKSHLPQLRVRSGLAVRPPPASSTPVLGHPPATWRPPAILAGPNELPFCRLLPSIKRIGLRCPSFRSKRTRANAIGREAALPATAIPN